LVIDMTGGRSVSGVGAYRQTKEEHKRSADGAL